MFGYEFLTRDKNGILEIEGCNSLDLLKEYGSPLYVMNESDIINRCTQIRENHIEKHGGFAVYASKAFSNKAMYRLIKSQGLGIDVVSGGEMYTAKSVDFPMENVVFHGNNKSPQEIEMAIEYGVGRVIIDNFYDVENVIRISNEKKKKTGVMVRVAPGVEGDTHDFIKTGHEDSKFGFSLNDGSLEKAVEMLLKAEYVNFRGIHAHVGSQLLENEVFKKEVSVLAKLYRKLTDMFNIEINEINLGGGFGIFYTESDTRLDVSYFTDLMNSEVDREFKENGLKRPMIIIEPGRWVVGEAGVTLYTVGAIKNIEGVRKYISVDGGMTDNPRPPLYGAEYLAVAIENADREEENVTVAGKCCESGDILINKISLPERKSGDHIGILSTGAYNYSMSSNYNRLPKPAVVMVKEGTSRLIVKRETYEDIIRNDI
ncbi:diaminopimelate decarboxylase [Clostridium cylindrosporum]|uniref:Diaminopimelate decarboxylase n=1 Tax=Clostridium cylindrosporum DSM 605 TaxID=1121307 RepID=A0A0J8D967_CLOCY|nr:diaminopimelate decarboxylase [Clostridium cylindrosporum]KMT20884.1 diaminopimelate decarboxylase LysA [Clostridium cylindrosporum DSM 605]